MVSCIKRSVNPHLSRQECQRKVKRYIPLFSVEMEISESNGKELNLELYLIKELVCNPDEPLVPEKLISIFLERMLHDMEFCQIYVLSKCCPSSVEVSNRLCALVTEYTEKMTSSTETWLVEDKYEKDLDGDIACCLDSTNLKSFCGETTKYKEMAHIQPPPRFPSTTVRVAPMDTLEAALEYIPYTKSSPMKIAVLNMVNPRNIIETWKTWERSHEKDILIQTGLSKGLNPSHYPLDTFSCLYTKDVSMIRYGMNRGYSFIPNTQFPVFDVISMAGVAPSSTDGTFTGEDKAALRTKCEVVLNVCAQNDAAVLILGAIGCGAFPASSPIVAAAFRSAIELYAGRFKEICFAILDPAVASVFAAELVGSQKQIKAGNPHESPPSREYPLIFPVLPPPTNLRTPLCESCGSCVSLAPGHYTQFAHPPYCPCGHNCPMLSSPNHAFFFMHKVACPMKGKCQMTGDKGHLERFTHPAKCPRWAECDDDSEEHLLSCLHPPVCPNGVLCGKRDDLCHAEAFRHISMRCPYGTFCRSIHDLPPMKFASFLKMLLGINANPARAGMNSVVSLCRHQFKAPDIAFVISEKIETYFRYVFNAPAPYFSEEALNEVICSAFTGLMEFITEGSGGKFVGVRDHWKQMDAHFSIDLSLLSLVPLGYVKRVIIEKSAHHEIVANPVVSKQFNLWRRHYGLDFIDVVNTVDEVRRKGPGCRFLFSLKKKKRLVPSM